MMGIAGLLKDHPWPHPGDRQDGHASGAVVVEPPDRRRRKGSRSRSPAVLGRRLRRAQRSYTDLGEALGFAKVIPLPPNSAPSEVGGAAACRVAGESPEGMTKRVAGDGDVRCLHVVILGGAGIKTRLLRSPGAQGAHEGLARSDNKKASAAWRTLFHTRAGDGNRTHVTCLEGRSFTIKLHPHIEGGMWE
jgi:hypothetical protein